MEFLPRGTKLLRAGLEGKGREGKLNDLPAQRPRLADSRASDCVLAGPDLSTAKGKKGGDGRKEWVGKGDGGSWRSRGWNCVSAIRSILAGGGVGGGGRDARDFGIGGEDRRGTAALGEPRGQ